MKCILFTPWVSPHKTPLARSIAQKLPCGEFGYFYLNPPADNHVRWGWDKFKAEEWYCHCAIDDERLRTCDVLLTGIRAWDIFSARTRSGLISIYNFERWFKPPLGMLRLLSPRYLLMALRFVRLLKRANGLVQCQPIGIHAARDMVRLIGLFSGDLRCIFRAPKLGFEQKPCGRIWLRDGGDGKKYCLDRMRMWGYYVESSKTPNPQLSTHNSLRVLWAGRLLKLKRVDTIIRAVGELSNSNSNLQLTLDIYGSGTEEAKLKKLASKYGDVIKFHPPVSVEDVRKLMREHDIYVLASNGYEGWGAVVSEALEEGMKVIGTYEAGSSATILPEDCLFHAGDVCGLQKLLVGNSARNGIGVWTANIAAENLIVFCETINR